MKRLQENWKKQFNQHTLERGKATFDEQRVKNLKEEGDGFSASVFGRERLDVSLLLKNGNPIRMSCRCPLARSGGNCEHMAALLYAIEAKERAAGASAADRTAGASAVNRVAETENAGSTQEQLNARQIGQRLRHLREKKTSSEQEEKERLQAIARLEAMREHHAHETPNEIPQRQNADRAENLEAKDQSPHAAVKKAGQQAAEAEKTGLAKEQQAKARLEEERKAKQEQARQEEERKAKQEQARQEAERKAKQEAREKRKAERAQKEAERKAQAEEERRKQLEKLQAEEARREAIRQEKKAEEERRRQKKQRELEASRLEAEKQKAQEEAERKAAEERRKKEEAERKAAEDRQKKEETARRKVQEETRMGRRRQEAGDARAVDGVRRKPEQENKKKEQVASPEEYTLLGEEWREDPDALTGSGSIAQLEQYNFFDGDRILNSLKLPLDSRRQGEKLYLKQTVQELEISSGYERFGQDSEMVGYAEWNAQIGRNEFQTTITFSRTSVKKSKCTCPKCIRKFGNFGWYYGENATCEYVAAVLFTLRDFLKTHNIGDATDREADALMTAYRRKRANLLVADQKAKEESLILKPRLVKKYERLSISFRIGSGRLFVIKQLDDFCANVRNAATTTYGSSTEINHRRSNFTEESRKWLRFIERIVQEEEEFGQRLEDATRSRFYYQKSASVGSSLDLFGWRLDEFYNELGNGTVEYEDRDAESTRKLVLRCGEGNPHITMQISEARLDGQDRYSGRRRHSNDPFHGILVEGNLPELYFGMNCAYYIDEDTLRRSTPGFQEKIEDLVSLAGEDENFSFRIGRNNLSEFYYQFLPSLQDVVDVVETDPDRIHSFLPPQVSFVFYLDARDQDVVCSPFARYEEKELSLLDLIEEDNTEDVAMYRDFTAEQGILYQLMTWLPEVDMERKELNCGKNEDLIYRVMSEGVDEMLTLGEVQCTTRFRSRRKIRQVKVSVGVSVSSGLLDLDITTDDVPQDELLDILNSYRQKKNYYRLKDGSYVDLDDRSLEMLAELMDSMHLKPKEFVQGKMHLPMYRTLYLNKMLEENDSVYSDRDSHFREMVKGFKTVNDADFDVPKSLSKIMRKYQKDGYKWLRTLEQWQFGGILADDMGLGKTLQAIALLLSAKERREANPLFASAESGAAAQRPAASQMTVTDSTGTGAGTASRTTSGSAEEPVARKYPAVSLIVAPASLVFNWGEEFSRFAPTLRILLITGTQEERQAKIASCQDYDVLVTSYDLLKRDIHHYEGIEFEYEIIDEAQYIKNHTTAAAKAVKVVKSRYRFALTGTPIENRLSELWSIFDYLMPGFLYTYEVFKREIETPVVKYQDEQAMKRLQKMTGPFILRRLKEDVLKDLPDKLEEVRYVRMGKEQQQLYDGQVIHMRESIASQDAEEFNKNKLVILTELMRLRQICCDPSLCFDSYQGESSKADACLELIQSAIDGGHRMLVFSQFTSMLEILQKRLEQAEIPYFTITGSTSKQKRLELVKDFNAGSTPVFLISLKAGGVGLNLTGADVVIHYDPWWNVAAQNQATDRAHRIGQTKMVTVYKLIAKNSIEEKILKLQQDKRALADQVISGETGQLSSMTKDDLLELLDGRV